MKLYKRYFKTISKKKTKYTFVKKSFEKGDTQIIYRERDNQRYIKQNSKN